MQDALPAFTRTVNHARYRGQAEGHYESFFVRANHPVRPLAFWIRYTLFSPKGKPAEAVGQLWAIFFDGENNRHAVAKQEFELADCCFDTSAFRVRIGEAMLGPNRATGAVGANGHGLAWNLTFDGQSAPALLLPINLYRGGFPAAKSVVSLPMARFGGALIVNGATIDVTDWRGSQNHNWGRRHTDLYAWGQVASFDTHPGSFLEIATAKLRIGPFWSPPITPVVFRHREQEYVMTGLLQAIRAKGAFDYFSYDFRTATAAVEIEGRISARREAFVALAYANPPGGVKYCLNSKIASCRLRFKDKRSGVAEVLETKSRAAFEILTDDDSSHGVAMSA